MTRSRFGFTLALLSACALFPPFALAQASAEREPAAQTQSAPSPAEQALLNLKPLNETERPANPEITGDMSRATPAGGPPTDGQREDLMMMPAMAAGFSFAASSCPQVKPALSQRLDRLSRDMLTAAASYGLTPSAVEDRFNERRAQLSGGLTGKELSMACSEMLDPVFIQESESATRALLGASQRAR